MNVIKNDLELDDGNQFPNFPLSKQDSLYSVLPKNKFTLIDFWFAGCTGCVAQFPSYKKTYAAHKKDHFEMIGISSDTQKEKPHWEKMIHDLDLNWLQYLDLSGKETDKLYIRKFPTNFLVDSNGKIIKRDISSAELEIFLQKNLL